MKLAVALLVVLWATPSAAQSSAADRTVVEACLAEKAKASEQERCIGVIADACLEKGDDPSTHGMADCSRREHAVWDERLNRIYKKLMRELDNPTRVRLREMQRAWIAFEEKKCGFHYVAEPGSASIPMIAYCSMTETGRQALFLERLFGPEDQ
jgi:uncharacterized protein YecT (DUF1311 family)